MQSRAHEAAAKDGSEVVGEAVIVEFGYVAGCVIKIWGQKIYRAYLLIYCEGFANAGDLKSTLAVNMLQNNMVLQC